MENWVWRPDGRDCASTEPQCFERLTAYGKLAVRVWLGECFKSSWQRKHRDQGRCSTPWRRTGEPSTNDAGGCLLCSDSRAPRGLNPRNQMEGIQLRRKKASATPPHQAPATPRSPQQPLQGSQTRRSRCTIHLRKRPASIHPPHPITPPTGKIRECGNAQMQERGFSQHSWARASELEWVQSWWGDGRVTRLCWTATA
jgi:hypothetical protein